MDENLKLLTVAETADLLGISDRTIYNGVCPSGRKRKPFPVKPVRIGKSIRFDLRDLEKFVESLKE